jgi:hypothetical protein
MKWSREAELRQLAQRFQGHLAFGLPNDAGIASNQGFLSSGNKWQVLQFVIDNSWDFRKTIFTSRRAREWASNTFITTAENGPLTAAM